MRYSMKIVSYSLIGLIVVWLLGFVWFTHTVFSYIHAPTQGVGVPSESGIAVLTGGRHRIGQGLELLEQGKGRRLLISGVQKGVRLDEIAEKEGIHLDDDMPVDLGYNATTTEENAKEIASWADKYHLKTVYAVTSFYHIPRSRSELMHYMPNKDLRFVAVNSGYVRKHWWRHWGSFKFLAAEYMKFLAVSMQYW